MTTAALSTSPGRAEPRARSRAVERIALWFLAFIVLGFGLWAILREDAPPPAYYVVKWAESGKCTVVTERPEQADVRILWFSTLHDTAAQKAQQYREQRRCG